MSDLNTQNLTGEPENEGELSSPAVEGGVRSGGGNLRELLEQMQTGRGSQEEEQEEVIEYPPEATAAPYSPQNNQGAQPPYQEQDIKGNPYARARVLERDNRNLKGKFADLESKFNQLLDKVSRPNEDEEDVVPEDPVDKINYNLNRVFKEQEEIKNTIVNTREQDQIMQAQERANQDILSYRAQVDQVAPGMYQASVAHLANLWMSERMEDNDLSAEDAAMEVAKKAETLKLRWRADGKNPGEEFLKRAAAAGFRYNIQQPQQQTQPQQNARVQIQKENKKRQGVNSISGMAGSAPKNPLKRLVSGVTSEDSGREFHRQMSELAKSRGSYQKRIPLSEIIGDRIIGG